MGRDLWRVLVMRVFRDVRKAGFGGVVVIVMVILVVVEGVGFWGRGEVKMGISGFGGWCGVVCKCWFCRLWW